jgi:hypothetical protein
MWDYILLGVVVLFIAALVILPNIGRISGTAPAKCSSCPKQAAREAAAAN